MTTFNKNRVLPALIGGGTFARIPYADATTPVAIAANANKITISNTQLVAVLGTATFTGYGGSGKVLALQEAVMTQGSEAEGITTASAANVVHIFTSTGDRLRDADGDVVYGRITKGTSWEINLFGTTAGVEAAYTNGATAVTGLTILVPVFAHHNDIGPAASALADAYLDGIMNVSGVGGGEKTEVLTVTVQNELPPLTKATPANYVKLLIGGVMFTSNQTDPVFTFSGKVLTFTVANFPGGKLPVDTEIIAFYS